MNIIAAVCFIWTIVLYALAKKCYRAKPIMLLSPAITFSVITIAVMQWLNISYADYNQYTRYISGLLGPATVAFAIPIYQYREVMKRQLPILLAAIIVGMSVGVGSAYLMARLFHFNHEVTYSLMARSVSTPFAIELADKIHGSAALVSVFTIITGLAGMLFGDITLAFSRSRLHLANGAAFGNAAHGFGTSRAIQRNADEGVVASLTMILAGLFMVLVGPMLVRFIVWL
ncbi:LrgB family protein [Snodgrassella alvi]|uniref:LrgB family protein n=1 Tax=Snodgrassella alvi TaxID=1196083 RepID=UPI0029E00739|nr:LrgB family protein [Snodgrassella alvi]